MIAEFSKSLSCSKDEEPSQKPNQSTPVKKPYSKPELRKITVEEWRKILEEAGIDEPDQS